MNITIANHYGMCFGVRDALRLTHDLAGARPVTILGQLVHNPEVDRHLKAVGAQFGDLTDLGSSLTRDVVVTAHGAAERQKRAWQSAGFQVADTTCPLVRKAHEALAALVEDGYFPVVIGRADHVEVRGLVGDFPGAVTILDQKDVPRVPDQPRIGVISQTTQPLELALALVDSIKKLRRASEVRFVDTICHPTRQRQTALEDLCRENDLIVVIGGSNSNNTRQLMEKAMRLGRRAIHVVRAEELQAEWFRGVARVGVTAGTSTLDETVDAVVAALRQIAAELDRSSAWPFVRRASRAR